MRTAPRQFDKPPFYFCEQRGRKRAKISRVGLDRADVGSRPNKPVALAQDDPGPFVIQPESAFHRRRDLDRGGWVGGRRMGNGQDANDF